mgnify:CR=1 FL=1
MWYTPASFGWFNSINQNHTNNRFAMKVFAALLALTVPASALTVLSGSSIQWLRAVMYGGLFYPSLAHLHFNFLEHLVVRDELLRANGDLLLQPLDRRRCTW